MLEPAAPRHIGNYEIISHLKAGGMATLYLARRTGAAGFARHVAIKVVHPHLARENASFVRMFLDEALLCARIHHPNVVHVEELGELDGVYFLVMEYVHGTALAQLMKAVAERRRRLTPELAVSIAIQIADGLHAAHELVGEDGTSLGVVHRDVSPHNVLLSYAGHVKVIDFGIAKARSHVNETATKSLKGKLRYMAPEQAFGRAVDRRTDVYALGILLWEMLTLRRLFDGPDDFAVLDMVRDPTPVPPSRYVDGIPPALDAAVLRALSPRPDDRPASMQEFRRLLAEAVPGATALDAAHLAELIAEVLKDEIAELRQQVPDTLSALRTFEDGAAVLRVTEPEPLASSEMSPAEPPETAATGAPETASAVTSERPPALRTADPTVRVRGPAKSTAKSARSEGPARQPAPTARSAPTPLLVDELDDAPPKGKGALMAVMLLVLLVAGAGGVAYLRPDLVARLRRQFGSTVASAPQLAAGHARQLTREPQSSASVGNLLVRSNVAGTQVLLFVGRGPADVAELPLGVAHEFVAIADGRSAVRAIVPPDAEWDATPDGKRYDLPMEASEESAVFAELDLGATTLPDARGAAGAERGTVHVVTAPPGAKIYQLVGLTPDVRIANVRGDATVELVLFAEGHLPQRVIVGPSDWQERDGERSAEVSVTLAARPARRRREHRDRRDDDSAPLVGAPGVGTPSVGSVAEPARAAPPTP